MGFFYQRVPLASVECASIKLMKEVVYLRNTAIAARMHPNKMTRQIMTQNKGVVAQEKPSWKEGSIILSGEGLHSKGWIIV
jgi:hypothetical protein